MRNKKVKPHIFCFFLLLFISQSNIAFSQSSLPTPDHIVILILESHGYSDIIGSTAAPYINSLVNDTLSAVFSESYAKTHPSQPNYLVLYSGSTQGVTDDAIPSDNPFTTPNLGRQLIDSGRTFITYSEDLPEVGYNGATYGYYARKHNPLANWMGTGKNQVSTTLNQPFSAFPSTDFTTLPTVCYVVPNLENDMHNGSDPEKITKGDSWIYNNLDNYIQWTKTNNSLFILTFDEEGSTVENHILTIFTGQMVQLGEYSTRITHYSILHTIEKMYGLPYIGDSLNYTPITYCWKGYSPTSISNINKSKVTVYPNPTHGPLFIKLSNYQGACAEIYSVNGKLIQNIPIVSSQTSINTDGLTNGLYLLKIKNKEGVIQRMITKN